jgi:hypothetical protein
MAFGIDICSSCGGEKEIHHETMTSNRYSNKHFCSVILLSIAIVVTVPNKISMWSLSLIPASIPRH